MSVPSLTARWTASAAAWPLLLAAAAEATAGVTIYAYGPVFMRQAIGEPRLTVITLATGLASLATFLMAGRWGRWGDRTGRPERLVALGLAGAACTLVALPGVRSSALFTALMVVTTSFLAAVVPLSLAWLTVRHPERPGEAAAILYQARSAGWALGSFGSGWLAGRWDLAGIAGAMWLSAGLATAAAMATGLFMHGARAAEPAYTAYTGARPAAGPDAGSSGSSPARPGPGARMGVAAPVWRYPAVVATAATAVLTLAGNDAFFGVFGPYLTEYLGGSSGQIGLALGISSVLGIAVLAPSGRLADRWGPERVFMVGAAGYVVMYALVLSARHPWAATAAFALPMYPLIATGATGIISRNTPPERRGEAVGLYEGSAALAASLGSIMGGVTADLAGLGRVPALSWGLVAAGCLVAWRFVLGRR